MSCIICFDNPCSCKKPNIFKAILLMLLISGCSHKPSKTFDYPYWYWKGYNHGCSHILYSQKILLKKNSNGEYLFSQYNIEAMDDECMDVANAIQEQMNEK